MPLRIQSIPIPRKSIIMLYCPKSSRALALVVYLLFLDDKVDANNDARVPRAVPSESAAALGAWNKSGTSL